ncbi:MAG: efflux RND transporter periplasmic adaptor subunit [Xanthomonadales bacterium]|nr:efflux RND transporter periplasmic adaptor subunit [Gammaproteobacteria bacterium]MBT8052340.1 efflux RND transporter periplasmic adaptor subunit [Gammaproteobacteria bacterium]NND56550.1 efflux RND transporter periplasmic adaptor subunit [Xanthomonadales bacterium]NNK52551.1 efflux RND transporter periplasmic adaptor subunit [Xanthomonadales bacterium]
MNNKIVVTLGVLMVFLAGAVIGPMLWNSDSLVPGESAEAPAERKILYWVAPMDPNFRRDEPGKSPMGMDLVPVYEDEGGGGDSVTISPAVENNLGVRVEAAQVRPLWRRVEATGYVGFDETRISHISTRVQGWIVRLQADAEGERVSKGDLLFELYSPELVNAQKEYLQAARRGGDRLLAGAGEKLRALGMIPSEISALRERGTASENIRIVAPQDGIITSLSVREGMYIQPHTTIMSLADLSSVWLQAEVFESQADWVAAGQAAEATLDYMPGTEFSGQVDYVYPVLDPKTRTLRVRLRFDNPNGRLKPNMYARVSIYGRLKPNALTIPREALIPAPGRDRVVVALGDGQFRVHEVLTGLESGEYVEILAGIAKGDRIVTSSQFLIDSEASIAGSIKRLESIEPEQGKREPGPVFASGRIEEIDLERRRIRVAHGPIDALGWPGMIMVFDTRPGVDLGNVRVGQDIRFALVQEHAGEYVLEQIFSGEPAPEETSRVEPAPEEASQVEPHSGHEGHHHD